MISQDLLNFLSVASITIFLLIVAVYFLFIKK